VATADALVEGFRPGVAERLGVGPDECRRRNPRLIYGRMTGWGQDGPYAGMAGHDITYIATAGALHAIGPPDGPPQVPLNLIGDFTGALYLVSGLLAALYERGRSGEGQVIDAAMVDSTAHLLTAFHGLLSAGAWRDERGSNLLDGAAPFYGVYETADGGHLAVGALEPHFYDALMRLLGIPADEARRDDPATWPQLRERIATAVATRSRDDWAEVFAGSDACAAPVRSLLESHDDPHLRDRGTFVEVEGVRQPAPAPRFARTPGSLERPPPRPGAHGEEVFRDWLDTSSDEVAKLGES
jgi:alpha-methylacyl-CoA racemase